MQRSSSDLGEQIKSVENDDVDGQPREPQEACDSYNPCAWGRDGSLFSCSSDQRSLFIVFIFVDVFVLAGERLISDLCCMSHR